MKTRTKKQSFYERFNFTKDYFSAISIHLFNDIKKDFNQIKKVKLREIIKTYYKYLLVVIITAIVLLIFFE
jgi:hypothetical protein